MYCLYGGWHGSESQLMRRVLLRLLHHYNILQSICHKGEKLAYPYNSAVPKLAEPTQVDEMLHVLSKVLIPCILCFALLCLLSYQQC
jgi:hypothetical protein